MKSSKAIVLLTGFLLLVLVLPVLAAPSTILYTQSEKQFELRYPADWTVSEGFMGSVAAFISPIRLNGQGFRSNVNVMTEDVSQYGDVTLDDYKIANLQHLKKDLVNFQLSDQFTAVLAGHPAQILVYTATVDGMNLKFMQMFQVVDQRGYVVTFTALLEQYERDQGTGTAILKSVVIR